MTAILSRSHYVNYLRHAKYQVQCVQIFVHIHNNSTQLMGLNNQTYTYTCRVSLEMM